MMLKKGLMLALALGATSSLVAACEDEGPRPELEVRICKGKAEAACTQDPRCRWATPEGEQPRCKEATAIEAEPDVEIEVEPPADGGGTPPGL
jgi:hypothetical protein